MDSEPKSLEDIYKLLQIVLDKNTGIEAQLTELNNKFDTLSAKTNDLSNKVLALEQENTELKEKNQYLEQQHKKYNIVIYGLEGIEAETFVEVEKLLNHLEISYNNFHIRDCYRIGKKEGKNRAVVVELLSYNLKKEIFEKAKQKKLSNRNIFVTQHYTKEEYNWRKILHSRVNIARKQGLPAKIIKNKLYVDGVEYSENIINVEEEFRKTIINQQRSKNRKEDSQGNKQKIGYSTRSGGSRRKSNTEI